MTHPADKLPLPETGLRMNPAPSATAAMGPYTTLMERAFHESLVRQLMRQAYDADRPQWKDAPDAPGLWLRVAEASSVALLPVSNPSIIKDRHGIRYFGPIPGVRQMTYTTNPHNVLPNGLTLLQVNPPCAAQLDARKRDYGWLYSKHPDGQWVTLRKMSAGEIEIAHDQAADMAVLQGTKVREA